jgi:hypothetical protein
MTSRTLLLMLAVFAVPSTSPAIWNDDIRLYTSPGSPTNKDIFDFEASRSFPDPGYVSIDQSINIHGNEIDIWVLIEDRHTSGNVFAAVLVSDGAFFEDLGPLAPGTYQVNVEMWLTPWRLTLGGELIDANPRQLTRELIDAETLQLTIVPEPPTAVLLLLAVFARTPVHSASRHGSAIICVPASCGSRRGTFAARPVLLGTAYTRTRFEIRVNI